ncbi:granulysin [Cyrtonyx montezumae]|uniref:granulysin n=1 Tax=Cyrtonyx montezumae TaxID=9017 RepID=UPI0032DAABEA
MAAAAIVLLALGAAVQVALTELPHDDQHWNVATGSHWEQQWHLLQDGSAMWDGDEGDTTRPGKGVKCKTCTSVVKRLKKIVGDDPSEDTITEALGKVCGVGKRQSAVCKWLVKKFRQQLSAALQEDDDPRAVCSTLGLCEG